MDSCFSRTLSRFALMVFFVISIANQDLVRATISKRHRHHNLIRQEELYPVSSEQNQELQKIMDNIFAESENPDPDEALNIPSPTSISNSEISKNAKTSKTRQINGANNPNAGQTCPQCPKEPCKDGKPRRLIANTCCTCPEVAAASPSTSKTDTGGGGGGDHQITGKKSFTSAKNFTHYFDFDVTWGVLVALAVMIFLLFLIQWMVSILSPITTPNPVPWLRGTAYEAAAGRFKNVIASTARPSRNGQLKLWQRSLATIMVQTFVIAPIALLAVVAGHYIDSDEGLEVNTATFFVVFGSCTCISLLFFFALAGSILLVGCVKIARWQQNEILCSTPDDVVRRYSVAIAEQKTNPPRCMDICKKEDIQIAIDSMDFLLLRTQVVPFRHQEPEAQHDTWKRPFFPLKHEFKDRLAHFDLAQYLTVKLGYVISEILFVKHWIWLIIGPMLLAGVSMQWMITKAIPSVPTHVGVECAEFFVYALILLVVVLIIHAKLSCIKRRRFKRGLQEVDDEIERNPDSEAMGTEVMKTFIKTSQRPQPLSESREELLWFGEPGRFCGHNYLKYLLQVAMVFSSILMSIFCWHIMPLLWTKAGAVVAVVLAIVMLSAWVALVVWVPNVIFDLVLLGHCGKRFFDPTVIAKIESEGRARLEVGAETIFDCVLLYGLQENIAAKLDKSDTEILQTQAKHCFECLAFENTVDPEALAAWFNVNMVLAPVAFSHDFIMEKLKLESGNQLNMEQFCDLYLQIVRTRRALRVDFSLFETITKNMFTDALFETSGTTAQIDAEGFYDLINRFVRITTGVEKLTQLQRVGNENAYLAVAELFDVADLLHEAECDMSILIMVIKMYLPDW